MTLYDRFGAPVSHGNRADIDMFGDAVELMLAYAPDPATMISELLERAPDFIMARCFLAGIYLIASDKRRQLLMRRSAVEAKVAAIEYDPDIVKVSIVGLGMRSHAGIASRMFQILAQEGINIQGITTSEIKVSCIINSKYTELAVRALHTGFGLDDKPAG